MAVNKVDYGDTNLIDLTQDTVDENSVLEGYTFHGADGNIKEGKVVVAEVIDDVNSQSTKDALSANQGRLLNIGINKTRDIISDAWNSSTTYTVDQYCIYNDCLWKCKVQHTGQAPSEGTYWTKTQIDDEILAIKNDVSIINSNFSKKFAYVDFQLKNGLGYTSIPLPEGFSKNNCVVLSLLVLYNGNLYFYDDCTSFYVTNANGNGLQVYNSYEMFYGTKAGVALMRVDI